MSTESPAAHQAFVRGVLLLHTFEYPRAADAFRVAERLDPDLAMAYWGEALTHTHAAIADGVFARATTRHGTL